MVWNLFLGIILDFIWGYFLCVATAYASCKDGPPEPIDYTGGVGNMAPNPFGGEEAAKEDYAPESVYLAAGLLLRWIRILLRILGTLCTNLTRYPLLKLIESHATPF